MGAVKRTLLCAAAVALLLLAAYVLGTGFLRRTDAYIADFSVSEDGREMTLHMGAASSAGYLRKVAVKQQHGGRCYLDVYAAFGGINGKIGAKRTFTVSLSEDTDTILLQRAKNAYEPVLYRDADGAWHRIRH